MYKYYMLERWNKIRRSIPITGRHWVRLASSFPFMIYLLFQRPLKYNPGFSVYPLPFLSFFLTKWNSSLFHFKFPFSYIIQSHATYLYVRKHKQQNVWRRQLKCPGRLRNFQINIWPYVWKAFCNQSGTSTKAVTKVTPNPESLRIDWPH